MNAKSGSGFFSEVPWGVAKKPKKLKGAIEERARFSFFGQEYRGRSPFVHGYRVAQSPGDLGIAWTEAERRCNIPVQVKGGSLAQLSGVSPLSTGYYLTQKAARNQLRCPSPLSGKSKRKGGTHVKLTRHNGRAGKNGVYNPKHNDRSFDIANSEHIDEERAKQNLYWDCYNGFRNFKNPDKENGIVIL